KHIIYWDPTEPTATRPLAINITGDGLYFPTVDLTKNVCELVNASGDIAVTYDYAPFGAVSAGTPSGSAVPANPLQWSSEIHDSELDLIYYNFRHYSPSLGRFLSRDPIAEQGGLNLYAFVGNNNLIRVDQKGSACCRTDESISKYAQNGEGLPSPGPGDQINICWFPRECAPKDYSSWFLTRFPKTIAGAKQLLESRIGDHIRERLCKSKAKTFNPEELGSLSDVDIQPDMKRFGDRPQTWYERVICLGSFELKFEKVNIAWEKNTFSFTAVMYVWEQTGVSPNEGESESWLSPVCGKRLIRMGEWSLSGKGNCCGE
ncbi:MAG: RHS repeat-associated core domain-containing protein, partial [Opitutales bacterium]|nr:RHS repeat-associated core domain-containing protein [Opitutales bacterium]